MELEDFQAAADAAENLVRLDPDNADAIGTAYFAELLLGDVDRLIPSARRLADVNPAVVSNEMLQHAQVLFDDDLLAGSRSLLELIIEKEPEVRPGLFPARSDLQHARRYGVCQAGSGKISRDCPR